MMAEKIHIESVNFKLKILLVGNGKVGYTLAQHLSDETHDLVIVDHNSAALERASDTLDVLCVDGNGASGRVLSKAGVEDCDVIIATTAHDEVNMVCCLTAKHMGAKYAIARIRDPEYADELALIRRDMEIDRIINPEYETAGEISRLLRYPDANTVQSFTRGHVELICFCVQEGDSIVNTRLSSLKGKLPTGILFAAFERDGELTIPGGDYLIKAGDTAYLLGKVQSVTRFFRKLGRHTFKIRDVMIVGGGRITYYLAKALTELFMDVKIIEKNPKTCLELTELLPECVIINGDGTDQELLQSENIQNTDAFISLTDRDEDNLMLALYAKQCGAPKIVAKSNRQNYNSIMHSLGIDSIVSPKLITVGGILNFIRGMKNTLGSVMESLYLIADGKAEVMEFVVTRNTSFAKTPLRDLTIKSGILIGVIVHGNQIIVPDGDSSFDFGDRIVLIAKDCRISDLNEIFR